MKVECGASLVIAAVIWVPVFAGAKDSRPAGGPSSGLPPPVLNLRLTVSSDLPPLSRNALMRETESIWREGHIRLRWLSSATARDPVPTLRVLVVPRSIGSVTKNEPWPVGELLRFDETHAIAVASITGAQRVLAAGGRFRMPDIPDVHDHRLGVVLGRAVAHEIGHYLLHTNTHAQHGLMRANFDAAEFADLALAPFRLDKAAEAYLLALTTQGAGWLEHARAVSFSYEASDETSANLVIRPPGSLR